MRHTLRQLSELIEFITWFEAHYPSVFQSWLDVYALEKKGMKSETREPARGERAG